MKTAFWVLGAAATFGLLAFAFGYFDPVLTDERRLLGGGLIIAGMAIARPALLRLAADWPRLKPRHNVDLAFVQIGLALAVLTLACMLGGRFGALVAPLVDPTPKLVAPASV